MDGTWVSGKSKKPWDEMEKTDFKKLNSTGDDKEQQQLVTFTVRQ